MTIFSGYNDKNKTTDNTLNQGDEYRKSVLDKLQDKIIKA